MRERRRKRRKRIKNAKCIIKENKLKRPITNENYNNLQFTRIQKIQVNNFAQHKTQIENLNCEDFDLIQFCIQVKNSKSMIEQTYLERKRWEIAKGFR